MKATVVESTNSHKNDVLGIRSNDGKVHKSKHKEEENEEIKAYLTKLQELVPFMPKNRKLSKLEVITYVIDYIRDLRQTLGLPPQTPRFASLPTGARDPMDMFDALSNSPLNVISNSSTSPSSHSSHNHRQPLGVLPTPNNSNINGSCSSQEIPQLMDKSPSTDVDTRPLSC